MGGLFLKISLGLNKNKILKYIRYFFLYAFIGWVLESLYCLYDLGYFTKRGFLLGPLCPIYGFGAIMLIAFFKNYKNHSIKLFIYASVIFSIFEYFVSFYLEAVFKIKCWDYSSEFFNLNGRISIFFSVVWGFAAILFVNKVHPFIESHLNKVLSKFSTKMQNCATYFICFVFLLDNVLSCIKYLT